MRTILTIALLSVLLLPTYAQRSTVNHKNVPFAQIEAMIHSEYGSKVIVRPEGSYYLLGDFNGDGFRDIAVTVNVEEAVADLKTHKVRFIDFDTGSQIDPLKHEFHHCLGIAIIHGSAAGWQVADPAGKFLLYECFSSFKLIRKGQRIPRGNASKGPLPKPIGDSIFVDLESGATALLYWKHNTYQSYYIRMGD